MRTRTPTPSRVRRPHRAFIPYFSQLFRAPAAFAYCSFLPIAAVGGGTADEAADGLLSHLPPRRAIRLARLAAGLRDALGAAAALAASDADELVTILRDIQALDIADGDGDY